MITTCCPIVWYRSRGIDVVNLIYIFAVKILETLYQKKPYTVDWKSSQSYVQFCIQDQTPNSCKINSCTSYSKLFTLYYIIKHTNLSRLSQRNYHKKRKQFPTLQERFCNRPLRRRRKKQVCHQKFCSGTHSTGLQSFSFR